MSVIVFLEGEDMTSVRKNYAFCSFKNSEAFVQEFFDWALTASTCIGSRRNEKQIR